MTSTAVPALPASTHGSLGLRRLLGVVAASMSAIAIWMVAVPVFGAHLLVRFGAGAPQTVGLDFVIAGSLLGSLLGWGLLTVLERRSSHAGTIWTGVALVVLVLSLSLPLFAGTTMLTKSVLGLMHVAVAAVLIFALRPGASSR